MPYFSGVQNQDGPPVAKGYKRFSAGDAGSFTIPLSASRNEPLATNVTIALLYKSTIVGVGGPALFFFDNTLNTSFTYPGGPRLVGVSIPAASDTKISGTITANTLNPGEYVDVYVVAF